MSRPIPDYIPGRLKDDATAAGYHSIKDYCVARGFQPQWAYKFFQTPHKNHLQPYCQLAWNVLDISLDELAKIIESGSLGNSLELKNLSISQASKLSGLSDSKFRQLLDDRYPICSLWKYRDNAVKLRWSLDSLAKTVISENLPV